MDLSDREFYPCKCGYQVCMWCWHRIRETESGLCPACRTPYGEDPHQFSAVDVAQAIKANKEKEAAARQRERQLSQSAKGENGLPSMLSTHVEIELAIEKSTGGAMEVPKDRSQLANMRVIRRNLVYCVGLPPSIALEEVLKKPEYFGQYGRIGKIVLNRSQITAADPRRATASAYVTFVHKEDTLACILAMDGYHMDGRNIRASYGTSKYCSAFIKNVRCNNPDCTYLHEMGAAEDTFTKQEIQAGYVTSGRDVLARQQQIVAEQLRLAGAGGVAPRKRIGGGGPSGTGKAATHPVFPVPEFDEPSKPNQALVPPPMGVTRAATTTAVPQPRSLSTRASSVAGKPSAGPSVAAVAAGGLPPAQRKQAVSAASVVAGVHTLTPRNDPPEPHTTLTPLTPLKRTSKARSTSSVSSANGMDGMEKLAPARGAVKKKNGITAAVSSTMAAPASKPAAEAALKTGPSSIGGDVIGPPAPVRSSALASLGGDPVVPPEAPKPNNLNSGPSSLLGGAVYTGNLQPKPQSAIGRIGGADAPSGNNSSLWGDTAPGAPGGDVIGGSRAPGTIGNSSSALASLLGISLPTGTGSLQESSSMWPTAPGSAPTGPSPLSSLNSGSVPVQGNLIGGGAPVGVAGGNSAKSNGGNSLIGGIPIGGSAPGPIGGNAAPGGSNTKSDIALLQSLLPGVHITSGSETAGFGTIGGWNNNNTTASGPGSLNGDAIIGNNNNNNNSAMGWGASSAAVRPAAAAADQGHVLGTIGGGAVPQNQRGPGIW